MAKNHSSVAYVEPNYVFSGLTAAAGDGDIHDRAPDLEDYCIGLDIVVELSSRHKSVRDTSPENKVIVMSYEDRKGGKSTVRFMSGTRIGGYERNNSGGFTPKLSGQNVLTSYYADMHISDLVDYGTTELLGIKSVDIDYNSTCVPIINIKFTDVRGMSIFQPSELNDDKSFNGIRGFSKDNIAQSFFHAFFALPLPKFTIILKGFYGEPVSYQVMCDKFDTAFDSKNGYFDVSARFIGYAYSFMADVSLNALLAAPYSDFKGSEYWDSQVRAGRFVVSDKNGAPVAMPKLYDIRKTVETITVTSDDKLQMSTIEEEVNTHEIEIQSLDSIMKKYRTWYDALYTLVCKKYGEDYVYRFGGNDVDEDYRYVVILTNGKNIAGADLSEEYLQYDESFRRITGELWNAVDQLNNSGNIYRKLDNVREGFKYPRVRTFKEIWLNDRTRKFMMDGFHPDNVLPRKEALDVIFGNTEASQQKALKKIYNDGKYQYIDAFVIDLDYTDIRKRILSLREDADKQMSDKVRERKALNRHMYEKLGWYPTIENFTKIVMAHLETLMAMMYDIVDSTASRTVSSLGVACGDDGVVDINQYDDHVAPFPRLTTLITDSDGYTKSEDAWAGNFTRGEGFREVDIVNGLFNGVSKINEIEGIIKTVVENINNQENGETSTSSFRIPMPVTPYDFFLKENPYGDENDVVNSIEAFAGKVCMRMFGIMELSFFRNQFQNNWVKNAEMLGVVEAMNFLASNKLTNPDLVEALGENGSLSTADDVLQIVKGNSTAKLPWDDGNEGSKALFKGGDNFWLSRYRINGRALYPIQGMSFKGMNEMFGVIAAGKTPVENERITVVDDYYKSATDFEKFMKLTGDTTILNTIKFTDQYQYIWEIFNNAQSSNCEEYKNTMGSIADVIKPGDGEVTEKFISSYNMSFCNCVGSEYLLKGNDGSDIPICSPQDVMYAGIINKNKKDYTFDGSNYTSEMTERNIQSYTLTQCFGYKWDEKGNDGYVIDKNASLFMMPEFYKNGDNIYGSNDLFKAVFFLMGFDCIDYTAVKGNITSKTFNYIPNLAALQIGAAMAVYYSKVATTLASGITIKHLKKYIPIPDGLEALDETITSMSPYCKVGYIKYFKNWVVANSSKIKELYLQYKGGKFSCIADHYEKVFYNEDKGERRALFRETSPVIKDLTNNLMSLICIIRYTANTLNVTAGDDGKQRDGILENTFKMSESQAKVYINAFLKTVRAYNAIENSNDGGPTTIANNPSQTNEDMKIELYRYLKQLYDKWVSSTDFKTWKFDQFFNEENKKNPLGNNFFFIDSFYNKIGDKLLINPIKLSGILKLATTSMDTNTMMYSFLAQMYGEHRCMMKCVQNFKLLSEGINNLFVPVPYERMAKPDPLPDFVVIYTYESSRNLSIANSEYKDDGFMLNDEFETPLPIRSRGDDKKFYKIPAFGVTYGRQYQNYFKSVNVNMAHPVMTEQAIIAKHNILASSRNQVFKNVTAQDLYDIYSNQSYTCVVEMMGCAYVQPLMYFVLLNVPFFKGSYLISKVKHRMTPGDMTTEITGVRMSKYCNKIVTDIFTDESDETLEGGSYAEDRRYLKADTTNDCPYKVFPIINDVSELTGTEKEKAKQLMNILSGHGFTLIAAAGIVGNMRQEAGASFDHTQVVIDSDRYPAGGLCGWNDRYYNLLNLIYNKPSEYGSKDRKKTGDVPNSPSWYKDRLIEKGMPYQIDFLCNTMSDSLKTDMNKCTTPEGAAKLFRDVYEKGSNTEARQSYAKDFYKSYSSTTTSADTKKKVNDPKEYTQLFVAALQKSINSTSKYAAELKTEYFLNAAVINIDNGAENLAVLFDIILNSDEYYSHVASLTWVIDNSPSELPKSLVVVPSPNVQSRRIAVGDIAGTWNNKKLTGQECNERLMQTLAKKYMSNKDLMAKECPQFSNAKDAIDKFKPADCNSLFAGSTWSTPSAVVPNSAKITIDTWDVEAAVSRLVRGAAEGKTGVCATYVEIAIAAGGGALKKKIATSEGKTGTKHATNLRYDGILEKHGFVQITPNDLVLSANQKNVNMELQAGDVAIIGTDASKTGGSYHACMWSGSQWISDFRQNNLNVYKHSEPCAIYRYHNKKGIPKS